MSAVVVCLDCAFYQKGGYCRKIRRDISALNPACENALAPDQVPEEMVEAAKLETERRCTKCRQVLPLSEFDYTRTNKGEKIKRKICKTCHHESMRNRARKNDITKTNEDMNVETKHCNKCGQDLPLSAFGKKANAKDGLQSWCRKCTTKAIQDARKAKKAAKEQEQPTPPKEQTKTVVVRETLTDEQMVQALRAHGWEVTCKRTITEEL